MTEDLSEGRFLSDNDEQHDPERELRDMLNQFLSGAGGLGANADASSFGSSMGFLMQNLQGLLSGGVQGGIDWSLVERNALAAAAQKETPLSDDDRREYQNSLKLAELWLSEATTLPGLTETPAVVTRSDWIRETSATWIELAEPVAQNISRTLSETIGQNIPEEFAEMLSGSQNIINGIGGTIFAAQLGQVISQLSTEVLSGGDIGMPLVKSGRALIVPQNIEQFAEGLSLPATELQIYLGARELAHARLFRHAKWLALHISSILTEHASHFHIDTTAIIEFSDDFDPSNPEQLREAMNSGALLPKKTEAQLAALARLSTTLALIEGWVEVVTEEATTRLPKLAAISETVRRRRATGGPAEAAFSALAGLELRPKLLREAADFWRAIGAAHGSAIRDSVWDHPDLMPDADDIADPSRMLKRLGSAEEEPDEFDEQLRKLLDGEAVGDSGESAPEDEPKPGEEAGEEGDNPRP